MTGTPLEPVLRAHGAVMAVRHGQLVAVHFGSVASETAVCLRSVGLADGFGRLAREARGEPVDAPAHAGRLDHPVTLELIGPRAGLVLDAARLDAAPFRAIVCAVEDGHELLVRRRDGAAAWQHLLHAGEALGISCVGYDAVEHLAISRHAGRL